MFFLGTSSGTLTLILFFFLFGVVLVTGRFRFVVLDGDVSNSRNKSSDNGTSSTAVDNVVTLGSLSGE